MKSVPHNLIRNLRDPAGGKSRPKNIPRCFHILHFYRKRIQKQLRNKEKQGVQCGRTNRTPEKTDEASKIVKIPSSSLCPTESDNLKDFSLKLPYGRFQK